MCLKFFERKKMANQVNLKYESFLRAKVELPEVGDLTIGAPAVAVGILAAPVLAALGAFAALVTECTIEVEKMEKS